MITNIGTCHLENLGDRDGVLKAKTEIFKYLKKDGHIVLNGDDDKLCTVKAYEGIKPVFFGMEADKDIYADEIVSRGLKGMTCRIHVGGESFVTDIPMPGRHMVYNALQLLQWEESMDLPWSRSAMELRPWRLSAADSI